MSRLTLTYTQAETFWLDMAQLRLWQAFTIDTPVEEYQKIISHALEQGQLPQITLEIVYAHAVKIKSSITNEKPIYFYPKNTC